MTFVKLQEGSVDTVVNRKITEVTNIYKENNTIDYSVAPFPGFTFTPISDLDIHPGPSFMCIFFLPSRSLCCSLPALTL